MRIDDFRYALRRMARSPGFTLVAVLSLALGIGANTAMFSLVNAVLLRELPVRDPGTLVEVYTSESDGYPYATSSYPDYADLREGVSALTDVVGSRAIITRLDPGGAPVLTYGELVSWDYFQALGVPMALGRPFQPEEDATPGTHPVVILGHRTWQTELGGDPDVVGRTVRLDGRAFTVVGVAPRDFTGSVPVMVSGLYVPLMMNDAFLGLVGQLESRGSRSMFLKGRLAPGATVERANEELAAFAAGLAERYPESNENRVFAALPTGDVALHPLVDRVLQPVAALLLTVVGLVLLVACANLASFLLARAEDRRAEIAVRLALGAARGTLVRQLLVETSLLALIGGGAGLLLADWTLRLLTGFQPPLPIPVAFDVPLDRTVLAFTLGVSILAGVAFGLAPALQATHPDLATTLKNEDRGRGGGRGRLRRGLVVVQVAFSFLLLVGAGLFLRSLQKAQRIDPGFDTGPTAIVWPMARLAGYESTDEVLGFYDAYRERLLAHPAVRAVAFAGPLPLGAGMQTSGYLLPGVPSESLDGEHDLDMTAVSPSYFDAMDVPIVRGRAFEEADVDGEPVVIVSRAFVERFYPDGDVVGRTVERGVGNPFRIVGVARDTKVRTLGEEPRPYVYHLHGQAGTGEEAQVLVKGRGTNAEVLAVARTVLEDVDSDMVVMEAKTMEDHLAIMLFGPRMAALLLAVFGALALTLAAIGIYGVVSHAVARRTRELGIRMSLGATARDIVAMAVGGGMRLVAIGGAIGIALAGAVTWALKGWLYGIGPTDLATFTAIPLILSAVALVAALVPALRAATVDPSEALRAE